MKTSGDDTQFVVDLGRSYSYQSMSIDMVVLENKFLNQYRTLKGDFADLSFQFITPLDVVTNYTVIADQYIALDTLSAFILAKTNVQLNAQDNGYGKLLLQPTRLAQAAKSINFTGFGWTKLGMKQSIHPTSGGVI
jgi:hypothetical protein